MVTFGEAVGRIGRAVSFAELAGDREADHPYREWAKLVHPDAVGAGENEAADNDLMENEAEALGKLWRDGDAKYRPYAPRLLESFLHEDAARVRRRVNVIERLDGFVPLSRITA
ncbi:MAG TPA: hypothetical protein VGD29_13790 [Actinoplanes sp.]|jgi:hypothetical protein